MDTLHTALKNICTTKINVPLAKYSTFRVGGPARYFCMPARREELVALLVFLEGAGVAYHLVGGGSNTLFPDDGYDGVVIKYTGADIRFEPMPGGQIQGYVEAGALTAEVARKSVAAGATGFEWGVGVPGTIGGAIYGNAGAGGGEIKDIVESVDVWYNGEVQNWPQASCEFAYRHSRFKKIKATILSSVFVFATLPTGVANKAPLTGAAPLVGAARMLAMIKYRTTTQPKEPSCGCAFKNPTVNGTAMSAGKLIDQAGCKGLRIGGAAVSEVHGNFIVNTGAATAEDFKRLIAAVQERVQAAHGVALESEVIIV